jgi:hypothetical protein
MIEGVGFKEARLTGESGFKSSPVTMGMTFLAAKPGA